MTWIPYGDSGSLASPFDLSDDSFGSTILLSGQTKTTSTFVELDSSTLGASVLSLIGVNQLEIIDSESHIAINFAPIISPFIGGDTAVEAEVGPTQVWIG